MARRRDIEEPRVSGSNLTPLIDVVFQLLIFFMLVMDMARHEVEALTLPSAENLESPERDDPQLLLVNILRDGTVKIGGTTYWKPGMGDRNERIEALFEERRSKEKYLETPGDFNWVKYPLLIRADRSTSFEHIQKVLMIASKHGGVTRLQLGAKMEEGD